MGIFICKTVINCYKYTKYSLRVIKLILSHRHHRFPLLSGLISIIFLSFCLIIMPKSYAYTPQQGDIIFQTSASSQSVAIQQATHSVYSHMGIVIFKNNQPYVFEASKQVTYTPLKLWISHGVNGKFVAKRYKIQLTEKQKQQLQQTALQYKNKPYDLVFSWSDERIYCSELVWKIYFKALNLKIGKLQKLNDFDLTSKAVKIKLEERYGTNIPLNETVISPKAMFDSPLLVVVGQN